MRSMVLWLLLIGGVLIWAELAKADDEIRVRPIDGYVSVFGGVAAPFKTDVTENGVTARDAKLSTSHSVGGKAGLWFTAPRKALGLDLGIELDVTNFVPNQKAGQVLTTTGGGLVATNSVDLNATFIGINVLARLPVGITPELPNGRWFPYLGLGGGVQRLSFQTAGSTEGRDTSPAFQALGGFKVFLFKHVAVFAEGKYTYASHTLQFQGPGTAFSDKLTIRAVHGVGGLSFHF